jgi:putative nucleotidyltransferase with HDIG domain
MLIAIALWAVTVTVVGIEHLLGGARRSDDLLQFSGDAAFLLVNLFAVGLFLEIVERGTLRNNRRLLLCALIALTCIIPCKAFLLMVNATRILPPDLTGFFLPFALAPMLATILVNSATGIAIGSWTTLALSMMAGRSFSLFVTGLIATLIAAEAAQRVRNRSKVFRTGLMIGLSEMIGVFSITVANWQQASVPLVLNQAAACLNGGFFSGVAVLLLLPLFESLFHVTTDITLLELSDLGHPLLQRMAIEAPGTYHHSLVVANLAQAAADEIGANALLVRICAYFHDIGKLTKPEFFTENLQFQPNPHDDLPPSMSTLVITSHVKEGLSLALLYKLPRPVLDVIREHHGTSLVSYFHHKAKTQVETEAAGAGEATDGHPTVDESAFRYTGPKPSTRESAIICMADAVEAASRSLTKLTPGHIEELVTDIAHTKIEDGQLDECDITLAEMTRVRRSFVFTLTTMFHARVPYPKDENRDQQPAKTVPD